MKHSQFLAIAAASAILFTAGCTSATTPSSSAPAAESSSGCDVGGAKVAVVPHFQSPFTQQFVLGAQAAADECNAELQAAGPKGIDTPAQIQAFNDLVTTGAKAIVIVAYPSNLWVTPIDLAVEQGTEVGTVDVASPESKQLIMAAPKQTDFGRALGEALAEVLGPDAKGDVLTGICLPGLDVLEQRLVGFKEVMNEKVPGVNVATAIDTTFEPAKNFSAWEALMQQNPDAVAVVGICDGDAANLAKVREQASDPSWIIAAEGGLDPIALKAVKDGSVAVVVDAQPFLQGYTAMRALLTKVAGGTVPTGWINTGTGNVTPDNIAEITAREDSVNQGYEDSLAFYQADIDRIFGDLESNVKPFADFLAP